MTEYVRTARMPLGIFMLLAPTALGADAPPKTAAQPVDYMIVVTGTELLEGAYADGHTHFLTRVLHPLGLHCVGSMIVDDKPADLKEALRYARGKAALVIVTGGLGPTPNDITRETIAEFTGIKLQEQPDVLADMERRFKTPRDQLRPGLRRQCLLPEHGGYLKNPHGTAVGLVFELGEGQGDRPRSCEAPGTDRQVGQPFRQKGTVPFSPGGVIVALPGPPRELQPMARDELIPYLSRRFGTRLPGASLTLRFVGMGQSQIDQTLKEHVPLPADVTVMSWFEGGRVDFTFLLRDDTPQGRARLQDLKTQILKRLGDNIYADDATTLEEHVAKLLAARGTMIALAEVASSGSLAAGLAGCERARQVLAGAYVAPTEDALGKLLRVPADRRSAATASTQRLELLASAAAELTGSQAVVVVGEARDDKGGARQVQAVFKLPGGRVQTHSLAVRGSGELARANLATQLLDQLRRALTKP